MPEQLFCPHDHLELSKLEFHGSNFIACHTCRGLLISVAGMLSTQHRKELSKMRSLEKCSIDCPICHEAMGAYNHQGVEIDLCNQCAVVWLDEHELQVIDSKVPCSGRLFKEGTMSRKIVHGAGDVAIEGIFELGIEGAGHVLFESSGQALAEIVFCSLKEGAGEVAEFGVEVIGPAVTEAGGMVLEGLLQFLVHALGAMLDGL